MSETKILFYTILAAQSLGLFIVFVAVPAYDKVRQLVLSRKAS